jgi:hypothetical protein
LDTQLRHLTYTEESIRALNAVRQRLDEHISGLKIIQMRKAEDLTAYNDLGSEFASIAEQVGQLKKHIAEKEWMLMKMLDDAAE